MLVSCFGFSSSWMLWCSLPLSSSPALRGSSSDGIGCFSAPVACVALGGSLRDMSKIVIVPAQSEARAHRSLRCQTQVSFGRLGIHLFCPQTDSSLCYAAWGLVEEWNKQSCGHLSPNSRSHLEPQTSKTRVKAHFAMGCLLLRWQPKATAANCRMLADQLTMATDLTWD